MKKYVFQGILALFVSTLWAQSPGDIVINEFLAENQNGAKDENGQTEDWLELHNTTNSTFDLKGFRLTDKRDNPDKWDFPQGSVIGPKGYIVVWMDEDSSQGPLHANFKLAVTGEFLMLSAPNGTVFDSLTYGQQITDISFGRFPNGTGPFTTMPPTFSAINSLTSAASKIDNDHTLRLYPNPSSDFLLLSSNDILGGIEVWNAQGRIILRQDNIHQTAYRLQLGHLSPGIYRLKTDTGGSRTFVKNR